jgi:hypothetical protein
MKLPAEWRLVAEAAVGGLTELGLSTDDKHLLVVTHSGRGLFETETGVRVARDYEAPAWGSSWLDQSSGVVDGIGPLVGVRIRVVGLWGGTLPLSTDDGWSLVVEKGGPTEQVLLCRAGSNERWVIDEPITELRAAGFSNTGRYLVVASSSDLRLLARTG